MSTNVMYILSTFSEYNQGVKSFCALCWAALLDLVINPECIRGIHTSVAHAS